MGIFGEAEKNIDIFGEAEKNMDLFGEAEKYGFSNRIFS